MEWAWERVGVGEVWSGADKTEAKIGCMRVESAWTPGGLGWWGVDWGGRGWAGVEGVVGWGGQVVCKVVWCVRDWLVLGDRLSQDLRPRPGTEAGEVGLLRTTLLRHRTPF